MNESFKPIMVFIRKYRSPARTDKVVQVHLSFILEDVEKTFPDRFEPLIGTTIFKGDTQVVEHIRKKARRFPIATVKQPWKSAVIPGLYPW
jgi:hypothetical protein